MWVAQHVQVINHPPTVGRNLSWGESGSRGRPASLSSRIAPSASTRLTWAPRLHPSRALLPPRTRGHRARSARGEPCQSVALAPRPRSSKIENAVCSCDVTNQTSRGIEHPATRSTEHTFGCLDMLEPLQRPRPPLGKKDGRRGRATLNMPIVIRAHRVVDGRNEQRERANQKQV